MKRLAMIGAVVVAMASGANAVSVFWGAGVGLATDGASPLTSGTAYLLFVDTDGLNASWNGSSWSLGNDTVVASATIGAGSFSGKYVTTGSPVGQDVTGAKYVIFVTTAGASGTTLPTSGFYGASTVFTLPDQTVPTSGNFFLPSNVGATTAIVPVPEPASMALVLVGAGAMALRRRFKKQA